MRACPKNPGKLKEVGLYAKLEKCAFSVEQITFLCFMILANRFEMYPVKVDAIYTWEASKCVKDVQCLLGFANLY